MPRSRAARRSAACAVVLTTAAATLVACGHDDSVTTGDPCAAASVHRVGTQIAGRGRIGRPSRVTVSHLSWNDVGTAGSGLLVDVMVTDRDLPFGVGMFDPDNPKVYADRTFRSFPKKVSLTFTPPRRGRYAVQVVVGATCKDGTGLVQTGDTLGNVTVV